jgi:CAAX prenyl protease-like protein
MTKSTPEHAPVPAAGHRCLAPAVARIAPFGAYVLFMVLADLLRRCGCGALALHWWYPAQIAAVTVLLWRYRHAYGELRAPRVAGRTIVAALMTGSAVVALWITLDADWMVVGASAGFDPGTGAVLDWARVAARWVGAALVVPLMEELFWRAFLLRWLVDPQFWRVAPARVSRSGFWITAALFAVEHDLWLAGLLAGAAFNLLYIRSGTLWAPLLAHGVANALLGAWVIVTGQWHYW